jgi:hypothetical protein
VLEARFENIRLPDSTTNEVKSHGALTFSITPLATLQVNQRIYNHASIYFDYNTPVKTNQVSTLYRQIIATLAPAPALAPWFPNPTTGIVSLQVQKAPQTALFAVDATGKAVKIGYTYQANRVEANVQYLLSGLYTLRFADGTHIGRVLVQPF